MVPPHGLKSVSYQRNGLSHFNRSIDFRYKKNVLVQMNFSLWVGLWVKVF